MSKINYFFFMILFLVNCISAYGASGYVSIKSGSWSDPAVWTLPWGSAPVPPQGNQDVLISAGTIVTGATGNTYNLDVKGTLIFNSNYSNSSGGLIIEDGATLIINGNLSCSSNIQIIGTGVLKVTGNLTQTGGTININNSGILIVGQNFTEGNQTTNVYNNATILVIKDYIVTGGLHENGAGTEVTVLGTVVGSGNPTISNAIPTLDPAWVIWTGGVSNLWSGSADSNWSNTANWTGHTIPVSGGNVDFDTTVPNDLVLDGDRTVGYLTITSSHRLIIPPGKCLTVNATIITSNDPNQIYIQSSSSGASGSLIFHNPVGSPVQATVDMFSLASWNLGNPVGAKYKWQFFGIPVRSLSSVSPTFDGSYIREMHENDSPYHWEQLSNTSSMSSFHGYEITQATGATYTFQGALENSDYTSPQSFTSNVTFPGEHLIANSYTASIDIKKIIFGNQMLKTVYLYNTGTKLDWTNAGNGNPADSLNTLPGQYTAAPQFWAGTGSVPKYIPSMQSFLVRAKKSDNVNATLSIPYSSASTVVKNTTMQRSKSMSMANDSLPIWTQVDVKSSRFSDRLWIFTDTACTHSFDNGYDGEKFLGSYVAPQLYAMEQDGDYQVNSVDDMNNTYLGFVPGVDSIYTLIFTHHNTEAHYSNIFLVDSVSQKTIDITTSGSTYIFSTLPTDTIIKRFKIVTTRDLITNAVSTNATHKLLNVFCSQNTIFVANKTPDAGSLMIYDTTGRYIKKFHFPAHEVTSLPSGISPGVYVVKASTKTEKMTTQLMVK